MPVPCAAAGIERRFKKAASVKLEAKEMRIGCRHRAAVTREPAPLGRRGSVYADELYVYERDKAGYILGPPPFPQQPSGTTPGFNASQFA